MARLQIWYYAVGYQAFLKERFVDEEYRKYPSPQGIKRLIFNYILRHYKLRRKGKGMFETELPEEVYHFLKTLLLHRGKTGLKRKEVRQFLEQKPSVEEVVEKYKVHFLARTLRK